MTTTTLMTTEELLALPQDGMTRWLINGELRERPMTVRNRTHSRVMTRVAKFLDNWVDTQSVPRGQVLTGDAGVRLSRNPDVTVGADVLYVSPDVLARQTAAISIIDGIPTLVVEILSPNTTIEDLNEKIDAYLAANVPVVWIVDPYRRTVVSYQPKTEPVLFTASQDLTAEPHLPGFRVAVAQLFG
jgi:Uma2 family endonuclease